MSTLRVSNLQAIGGAGNINVSQNNLIKQPGSIIQAQAVRYDTRTTITTNSSTGGEIEGLRVSIAPKFSDSLLICTFQVHGEGQSTHDYIYLMFKDGAVPTGTYAGYNTEYGNSPSSGIAQALPYETDYSSTPFTQHITFIDYPGDTNTHTYAPGVRHSSGTNYTWYVNRTVGSTGANGHEIGVSFGIVMEVAQ